MEIVKESTQKLMSEDKKLSFKDNWHDKFIQKASSMGNL